MMELVAGIIAIIMIGVVFGVDVFFSIIGVQALRKCRDKSMVDVLGHMHQIADKRMPQFGTVGLFAIVAAVIFNGGLRVGNLEYVIAFLLMLGYIFIYNFKSKPIHKVITTAAEAHKVPSNLRTIQTHWDRIIIGRAILLTIVMILLCIGIM